MERQTQSGCLLGAALWLSQWAILALPLTCRATVMWNFEPPLSNAGLPSGWSAEGVYGSWSVSKSTLGLGANNNVLAASFDPPAQILLFAPDRCLGCALDTAYSRMPPYLKQSLLEAFDTTQFIAELATKKYDLAIFVHKTPFEPPSAYDAAFSALAQFVANGGRAIVSDMSESNAHAAPFGASFRPNLGTSFTVTNAHLLDGVGDPVPLTSDGVRALEPTTGVSAAAFGATEGSAIVIANDERSIFNAFSDADFFNSLQGAELYHNEIALQISRLLNVEPTVTSDPAMAGGASLSYPTQQPQIIVDSYTPSFRIANLNSAEVSFQINVDLGNNPGDASLDVSLVDEGDNESFVKGINLGEGADSPQQIPLNDASNIDVLKTYRLRLRVRDGDPDLTTLDRVEVDNVQITDVVPVGLAGDYNGDYAVDAADYVVWRKNVGGPESSLLNRDSTNGGPINADDYTFWRTQFGKTAVGSGALVLTPVPEPSAMVLTIHLIAMLICFVSRNPNLCTSDC